VLENFARIKNSLESNIWKLNSDRVEECYFIWKIVNVFNEKGFLYMLDTNQIDQAGKRRCLDACLDAWNLISKLENEWIQHKCEKKGCAEGYNSFDGLEKVYRLMCATPREKIRAGK
jgi:hypothetical protein